KSASIAVVKNSKTDSREARDSREDLKSIQRCQFAFSSRSEEENLSAAGDKLTTSDTEEKANWRARRESLKVFSFFVARRYRYASHIATPLAP
ncbi:MAG: hypothetical protein AAB340_02170, partial [Patescibacteria group bacterium]